MSSSAQESIYYPMSSHGGLLPQAPVMAQAQTTPLSQQTPSLSVTSDAITSPLSPRLQFSAPPMRYICIRTCQGCIKWLGALLLCKQLPSRCYLYCKYLLQ